MKGVIRTAKALGGALKDSVAAVVELRAAYRASLNEAVPAPVREARPRKRRPA